MSDTGAVSGRLFVVATPIGNLGDLSARALSTLRECDVVAAEDTRRTRALLTHFAIHKPVVSLHAHSDSSQVERLVERIRRGESVALVTDAGTPSVSDPGEALVRAAIAAEIAVTPIPGASAVLAALVASGIAGEGGFRFVGFLPRDGAARRKVVELVCDTPEAVVLFESPNRTRATLEELAAAVPSRAACVARELTKLHEEFVRGSARSLADDTREWMGEVVIVLGPHDPGVRGEEIGDAAIDLRIDAELAKGVHARSIAEQLAAWSGRPRRAIYERVILRKRRETR